MEPFDQLPDPVFIHDQQFRILRCNTAYAAYAGLPMEAIVGKPYWQVFPKINLAGEADAEAPNKELSEARTEFTTEAGEIFLTRDITAHRPSGEFWYSRHLLENITERRRNENARKLRASFLEAVIDSAPGVFAVTDRQGKLIRWNRGLNNLTGCSDAQLEAAPPLAFVVDADKERMMRRLEEAFTTGGTQGEVRIRSHEGKMLDVMFSARRFEVAGEPYVASFSVDTSEMKKLEHELSRERAISDSIIEAAPGAFFMVDQQLKLVRWNGMLREDTGWSDEQLRARSFPDLIHEEDRQLATAKMQSAFATGYSEMEVRVPTRNHGVKYFFKTARRLVIDEVSYVAGFCVDVTERRLAEKSLIAEKAFSDALIESAPGAFFVINGKGDFFRWNSYINRLTGLSDSQLQRRPWLLTIEEKDQPLAMAMMRDAMSTGFAQAELHVITRELGTRVYAMSARRFKVDESTYLVGIGLDTTEQFAKVTELEHQAQTDSLTQLACRGYFLEIAKKEFDRCRRYGHQFSLWMLDIDHFKVVNDTYGHRAGDVALQSLVATSRRVLRDWDIMGRIGGEEFAVLLPETDVYQALLVAERFRKAVADAAVPVDRGKVVKMTVSTGVATSRNEDTDIEALLVRADEALYEAKRTGRDKVCVAEHRHR
ncbi:MAG: diguanylate cyclase [Bacteroidota bacterium]